MSDTKSRYVLLCQQVLALGTVAALAAPATGVVSLDIVDPSPLPTEETASTSVVTEVPTNGRWSVWEPAGS
jgi:hypothetical protein